jgi:hypothetical protein
MIRKLPVPSTSSSYHLKMNGNVKHFYERERTKKKQHKTQNFLNAVGSWSEKLKKERKKIADS